MWWRGFWCTLAALVAMLLAIMAVDAAFDLESVAVRSALTLSGLAVVGGVAWRTLVRPLSRTIGRQTMVYAFQLCEFVNPR